MRMPADAQRLRIFIGEADKFEGRPLYQVIVEEARRRGLAGATVLKGELGFGAHSCIQPDKFLRLSPGLPMVIEIVDQHDRIVAFLPDLDSMIGEGLVTLEQVKVIIYRHDRHSPTGPLSGGP